MRILGALRADMKFQFKQGFYLVYVVVTLFYMIAMSQLPDSLANTAVPLVVFSDPSVVGFFFIGGIVMLEKVQGILQYVVITPLTTREYLISKVISLSTVALAAGFSIAMTSYRGSFNWGLLALGILLTSSFFTLFGFAAVSGCSSMNQYFIKMVPYMLIIVLPCFSLLSNNIPYGWILNLFPSVAGLKLVYGAFHGIGALEAAFYAVYMFLVNLAALQIAQDIFNNKIIFRGEGR